MKPRTQEQLDEQRRLEEKYSLSPEDAYAMQESIDAARYVDAGVQAWKRRYDPLNLSAIYDDLHHSDVKHAQTFPKEHFTIVKGGK